MKLCLASSWVSLKCFFASVSIRPKLAQVTGGGNASSHATRLSETMTCRSWRVFEMLAGMVTIRVLGLINLASRPDMRSISAVGPPFVLHRHLLDRGKALGFLLILELAALPLVVFLPTLYHESGVALGIDEGTNGEN